MSTNLIGKRSPTIDSTVYTNVYVNNGNVYTYGQDSHETIVRRYYNSVNTPNFRTYTKHSLPLNPFTSGTEIWSDRGGVAVSGNERWEGSSRVFFPAMYSALGSGFDNNSCQTQIERATSRVLSQLGDMKVNLAQAFAERRQTAGLLISSVNRLALFAVLMRKGQFQKAQSILKRRGTLFEGRLPKDPRRRPSRDTFANLWLEYSYGWRPLVNDIYGSAELLANTYYRNRPQTVSGYAKDVGSYTKTSEAYGTTAKCVGVYEKRAKVSVSYAVSDTTADLLKSTGLSNPALLAWELLPYSFVVDWVYPVGRYLNEVNASSGLTFKKGYVTSLSKWEGTSSPIASTYNLSGFVCTERGAILQRSILGSFPSAVPPRFSLDLNLSQLTSGLALLNQVFGTKR